MRLRDWCTQAELFSEVGDTCGHVGVTTPNRSNPTHSDATPNTHVRSRWDQMQELQSEQRNQILDRQNGVQGC